MREGGGEKRKLTLKFCDGNGLGLLKSHELKDGEDPCTFLSLASRSSHCWPILQQ